MRNHFLTRTVVTSAALLSAGLLLTDATPGAQSRPRFYRDDPIAREPETQDASKTQEWDIGLIADLTLNVFGKPGDPTRDVRAQNINTIDEVPDSSWFTNRIYARPITVDEITRGPNTIAGPAPGKWTIIRPKTAGTAPGFTVRDEKGEVWFLSFDGKGYPIAATAAISVSSRLFWAMGYNVPESYVTSFRPENIVIGDTATIRSHGRRRRYTQSDLRDVLAKSNRSADGSYRALAQRLIPGRIIGGFRYEGTRPDDPNDIVAHEHRRELRAFQVFAGWTNLVDMKAGNNLDAVVTENGRSIVRHYLQDVGSGLGTGSLHPHEAEEGHEYVYEGGPTAKRLFSLGLAVSRWHTVDYDEHPEVGRFTADAYEPEEWKPRVPAPALLQVRADDTFWAALRVMAFTDELIGAAVKTGAFTDAAAEKLMTRVLIERRNKIARAYLSKINPLTKFALDGSGVLTFENPAVQAQVADPPKGGYTASWFRFDNATGATEPIGSPATATQERLQAPSDLPRASGSYVKVSISAVNPASPLLASWSKPVDVYFRSTGSGWQLVGVERLPPGAAPFSARK